MYVVDLKRGTNPAKGGRPKDIFEMGSDLEGYFRPKSGGDAGI